MSAAAITALLDLLTSLLPALAQGGTIVGVVDKIINTLIEMLPAIAQAGEVFYTAAKNVISMYLSSGQLTPAQFQALQAAESQLDASFEAAAAAAGDPAPGA